MLRREPVSDHKIIQFVTQRLSNCGLRSPSRVVVSSSKGDVTLSGMLQYEHQRQGAMQAARGVAGVRRIIDRLQVLPRKSNF